MAVDFGLLRAFHHRRRPSLPPASAASLSNPPVLPFACLLHLSSAPRCLFICLPPSRTPHLSPSTRAHGRPPPARCTQNTKCTNQKLSARFFDAAVVYSSVARSRRRRQSSREVSFREMPTDEALLVSIRARLDLKRSASLAHKRVIKRTSGG